MTLFNLYNDSFIYLYKYIIYFIAFTQSGGWSAGANNINQWIQAELETDFKITAVQTQGRQDYIQWVEEFRIMYSNDGKRWNSYKNSDGKVQVRASCT